MIDLELVYHIVTLTFTLIFNVLVWPAILIGIMIKAFKNLNKTDSI